MCIRGLERINIACEGSLTCAPPFEGVHGVSGPRRAAAGNGAPAAANKDTSLPGLDAQRVSQSATYTPLALKCSKLDMAFTAAGIQHSKDVQGKQPLRHCCAGLEEREVTKHMAQRPLKWLLSFHHIHDSCKE